MHLSDERMIVILLVGVAAGYLAGRFAHGSGSGVSIPRQSRGLYGVNRSKR